MSRTLLPPISPLSTSATSTVIADSTISTNTTWSSSKIDYNTNEKLNETTLDELNNIVIDTPLDSQALVYNAIEDVWKNSNDIKADLVEGSTCITQPPLTGGTLVASCSYVDAAISGENIWDVNVNNVELHNPLNNLNLIDSSLKLRNGDIINTDTLEPIYQKLSEKGQTNGYAPLDEFEQVPSEHLINFQLLSEKGQPEGYAPLDEFNQVPNSHLTNYQLLSEKSQPNGYPTLDALAQVDHSQHLNYVRRNPAPDTNQENTGEMVYRKSLGVGGATVRLNSTTSSLEVRQQTNALALLTEGTTKCNEGVHEFTRTTNNEVIALIRPNTSGILMQFYASGYGAVGSISYNATSHNVSYNPFTSSHYGFIDVGVRTDYNHYNVLLLTGNNQRINNDGEIVYGFQACNVENSKAFVGTFADLLDPSREFTLTQTYDPVTQRWITPNPYLITEGGNTRMCVANFGDGNIDVGTLFITSEEVGYAKMLSQQVVGTYYIIAKSCQAINWDNVTDELPSGRKYAIVDVLFQRETLELGNPLSYYDAISEPVAVALTEKEISEFNKETVNVSIPKSRLSKLMTLGLL